MCVEERQPAGGALDGQHEFLGLGQPHGVGGLAFVRLEIECHDRCRARLAGGQEGVGLLGAGILAGAEMVAAPQQPCRFGLAAARGVGGIEPVATFGHLVDDSQDIAAADRGEVGDGDVVADVDDRIQARHRVPGRRGSTVEGGARGRCAAASGEAREGQTGQADEHFST